MNLGVKVWAGFMWSMVASPERSTEPSEYTEGGEFLALKATLCPTVLVSQSVNYLIIYIDSWTLRNMLL
jgi:hypothetical protein